MKRFTRQEWADASAGAFALVFGIGYVAFPLLSYLVRRVIGLVIP